MSDENSQGPSLNGPGTTTTSPTGSSTQASDAGGRRSIWRQFPSSFWAANVMEIFERMGWYGFYAVSSLYLTGAVADGGLGLTSEDRGVIQGLATFFFISFRPCSGRWPTVTVSRTCFWHPAP